MGTILGAINISDFVPVELTDKPLELTVESMETEEDAAAPVATPVELVTTTSEVTGTDGSSAASPDGFPVTAGGEETKTEFGILTVSVLDNLSKFIISENEIIF